MVLSLINSSPSDDALDYVAAGPLEDGLCRHGEQNTGAISSETRTNVRFKRALASVVIDLNVLPETVLPAEMAISAITVAELSAGVNAAKHTVTRGIRLLRLQGIEATFEPIPFDVAAARVYGQLVGHAVAAGQNPRPRRMGLLIAATAVANGLALYTRNAADFTALHGVLRVVPV